MFITDITDEEIEGLNNYLRFVPINIESLGNAIGWIVLNKEYTYSSEMLEKQLKIFFEGKGVNLENILNFFKEVSIKKYIIGPELFLEMQQALAILKTKYQLRILLKNHRYI